MTDDAWSNTMTDDIDTITEDSESDGVMSARRLNGKPFRVPERVKTRDFRVPLSDDDRAMENGWQMIPIPPTNDPQWFIIDSSHDRKTEWGRWHTRGGFTNKEQ